jgi:ABC-2 type transport system permease protein
VTRLLALVRKELAVLFSSPVAYLVLTGFAAVTALIFFEHLRLYNQILFLYASTTMGGFETDTIPDYINLRDSVFFPVMEQLGFILAFPIPIVTMRVFAEERSRGTDELLATSGLTLSQIVAAKCAVTFAFVTLVMAVSFIYPTTAILQGGLGLQHLLAVFLGLTLLAVAMAGVGLVCSAFTSNQIVAAVAGIAVIFVLYDFGWTNAFVSEDVGRFLDAISLHLRFGRFSEGIVRLADLVFFLGWGVAAGVLARLSLELRRAGA